MLAVWHRSYARTRNISHTKSGVKHEGVCFLVFTHIHTQDKTGGILNDAKNRWIPPDANPNLSRWIPNGTMTPHKSLSTNDPLRIRQRERRGFRIGFGHWGKDPVRTIDHGLVWNHHFVVHNRLFAEPFHFQHWRTILYKFINHYQYSLKYSESMCSLRATVCWRTRSFCLHSKPKMEVGTWTFHVLQKTLTILVIVLYLSGSRFFCPLPCRLESRCTEPPGPLAGGPVFYFHRTVWSADWVIKMLLFWGCSWNSRALARLFWI